MASFRYRAQIPASELGWSVNDLSADTLILSKPKLTDMPLCHGKRVIADFCDNHFARFPHYRELLKVADQIVCPTQVMRETIRSLGRDAHIVPDPYELLEGPAHCDGTRLLWFGHSSNLPSLQRVMPDLEGYSLRVVSNAQGAIPWSPETMLAEFLRADIVILPATEAYKSPNRAIESIRRGCFVVAEPHPALAGFPIYVGSIKEGIEWAKANPDKANETTRRAQAFVSSTFRPSMVANAWRKVLASSSTSGPGMSLGPAGLP